MSAHIRSVRRHFAHPGSGCRAIRVARLRQLEAVGTVKGNHRRVQGDPNGRSLLKGVRSFGNNPRKVSVHFNILGEAASFLVDATTKGSRDLIANLRRNAKVGSGLYDDTREVTSKDRSWVGDTSGVCGCEC